MTLPLLGTRPSPDVARSYVDRILATYERATPAQLDAGLHWYPTAHRLAAECGDSRTGAGVIAALSANKGWPQNVALARQAFGGDPGGHTSDTLAKVNRILAGTDPTEVLPMALKTGQFFLCIADPADPEAVVIDRHAHDIVAGIRYGKNLRGLDSPTRYASIADAYRDAAKTLGRVPCEVQAITWTVITDASRYSRALTGNSWMGDGEDGS